MPLKSNKDASGGIEYNSRSAPKKVCYMMKVLDGEDNIQSREEMTVMKLVFSIEVRNVRLLSAGRYISSNSENETGGFGHYELNIVLH